jgi:hypothetical protein
VATTVGSPVGRERGEVVGVVEHQSSAERQPRQQVLEPLRRQRRQVVGAGQHGVEL